MKYHNSPFRDVMKTQFAVTLAVLGLLNNNSRYAENNDTKVAETSGWVQIVHNSHVCIQLMKQSMAKNAQFLSYRRKLCQNYKSNRLIEMLIVMGLT